MGWTGNNFLSARFVWVSSYHLSLVSAVETFDPARFKYGCGWKQWKTVHTKYHNDETLDGSVCTPRNQRKQDYGRSASVLHSCFSRLAFTFHVMNVATEDFPLANQEHAVTFVSADSCTKSIKNKPHEFHLFHPSHPSEGIWRRAQNRTGKSMLKFLWWCVPYNLWLWYYLIWSEYFTVCIANVSRPAYDPIWSSGIFVYLQMGWEMFRKTNVQGEVQGDVYVCMDRNLDFNWGFHVSKNSAASLNSINFCLQDILLREGSAFGFWFGKYDALSYKFIEIIRHKTASRIRR